MTPSIIRLIEAAMSYKKRIRCFIYALVHTSLWFKYFTIEKMFRWMFTLLKIFESNKYGRT